MIAFFHTAAGLAGICAIYLILPRERAALLLGLAMAVIAVQVVLTSLALGSQADWLMLSRPVLAAFIPPMLFLHARAALNPADRPSMSDALSLLPIVLVLADHAFSPWGQSVDGVLLMTQAAYAIAIARLDAPVNDRKRLWKRILVVWLIVMMMLDLAITLEIGATGTLASSRILIAGAATVLAALGYTLVSGLNRTGPLGWLSARQSRPRTVDRALVQTLESYMQDRRPWLDPELTLARLARQMGTAQRALSTTINDVYGQSFSRWLNTYRVEEAKRRMRLEPDRPLVELMLDCGFQTRSHFIKSFKDVTGRTPSAWRSGKTAN